MHQRTTSGNLTSSPTWEGLHEWLRNAIQALIQEALEAEVTELLGRVRYQRRAAVDAPAGYRNGYGKPRKLTTPMGTLTLRRPRVRGLEERFESRILPLFVRRTKEVSELLPELYLHGLAEGDFDLALRGLLGEEAPLSARTVVRLKERWQAEWEAWRTRRLDELQVVYLWVDGVYVKAGLERERERAALLVAVAGLVDGRKEVVAVVPGYRESVASWSEVLRDLRDRGMNAPRLVIGDGHLGIWGALRNVWPEAEEQRCWNHKVLNVLEQLPRQAHAPGHRLRPDPGGGGTEAQGVRGLVSPARLREGGGDAGAGLGAHGDVLPVPQGALAPPADHKRGGIPLRRAAAAYGRGQAVQEGGAGHGGDLEDAHVGPDPLPAAKRPGVAGQGLRRGAVRRRHRGYGEGGRRLSTFTHLLTEAPPPP